MNCPTCGYDFDETKTLECPRCGDSFDCSALTCSDCELCTGIFGPIRQKLRGQ
jgi:hypothetical protein